MLLFYCSCIVSLASSLRRMRYCYQVFYLTRWFARDWYILNEFEAGVWARRSSHHDIHGEYPTYWAETCSQKKFQRSTPSELRERAIWSWSLTGSSFISKFQNLDKKLTQNSYGFLSEFSEISIKDISELRRSWAYSKNSVKIVNFLNKKY